MTVKTHLPNFFICVSIFCIILFPITLLYFKDLHLPTFTSNEFIFKDFFLYTFGLKLVGYLFKVIFLSAVFYLGAFLFRVTELRYINLLSAAFLAEITLLLPNLLAILWFSIFPSKLNFITFSNFADSFNLNGLWAISDEHYLYNFISYFGIFDLLYVVVIAKLLNSLLQETFIKTITWVSITYFTYALLVSLIRIVITL